MNFKISLKYIISAFVLCLTGVAFATLTTFTYPGGLQLTEQGKRDWDAILTLFVQKSGDTMSGDLVFGTAGNGLQIKEGTNARMGQTIIASGSKIVSNTSVTASTRFFLSRASAYGVGTLGSLDISSRTAGFGFTIRSSSATDESTVNWILIEAP